MTGQRYSITPAKAVTDRRLTDFDYRLLALYGVHADKNGWCFLNQSKIAERLGVARQSVCRSTTRLVEFGYIERMDINALRVESGLAKKGLRSINTYRVIMDSHEGPDPKTTDALYRGVYSAVLSQAGDNGCPRPVTTVVPDGGQLNDPIRTTPLERPPLPPTPQGGEAADAMASAGGLQAPPPAGVSPAASLDAEAGSEEQAPLPTREAPAAPEAAAEDAHLAGSLPAPFLREPPSAGVSSDALLRGSCTDDLFTTSNAEVADSPDNSSAAANGCKNKAIARNQKASGCTIKKSTRIARAGTRLPDDWVMPADWAPEMVELFGLTEREVYWLADEFRDYWTSATRNAVKRDWKATFRNSIRMRLQRGRPSIPAGYRPETPQPKTLFDDAAFQESQERIRMLYAARSCLLRPGKIDIVGRPYGWRSQADVVAAIGPEGLRRLQDESAKIRAMRL